MHIDAARHYRQIEAVVLQRRGDITLDAWVERSWIRCIGDYALDPFKCSMPRMLDPFELNDRRISMGPAYSIAKAEITGLCETLDLAAGVVLTDAEGVILLYAGTPSFAHVARLSGFREGAVWSEAEQGTNGMGTCLVTRTPVVVERGAHFLAQNTGLTCYAAPLDDGSGRLLGALNISCLDSLPRGPMQSLLELAARNIQTRLLLHPRPEHFILRVHRRGEYIGTVAEGILTFTANGNIVAMNRNAVRQLESSPYGSAFGRDIKDVIGLSVAQLIHMHRRYGSRGFPFTWVGMSRRGFGLLHPPDAHSAASSRTPEAASALVDAESAALCRALEQCRWNVSQAARKLRIGRKTLYRKMHKHHLIRPPADSLA